MFCKHHPPVGLTSRTLFRRPGRLALVATILAGLAAPPFGAQTPESSLLMERVQLWLDGTRDLQGRFEQSLISGALGAGTTESGVFFLERPGRMRWDYLSPERKVALVRGGRTWFYIEEDEQLLRGRIDGSELLLRLLAGETPLAQLFEALPLETEDAAASDGSFRLTLIPRSAEMESFQQVVLRLAAPDAAITGAEVVDVAGNRVVYRFRKLRRNAGLRPDTFRFEPPEGTVILGEH